jgi:hypothetical protein
MKMNRTLQMWAALILGIWPATADCQILTYYYSGPVSGYTEVDLSPEGLGEGGFDTTFGTITETLYYDPSAQTIEQAGSLTVSPSTESINIQSWPGLPPESGSATLTVGQNGSFSFDNTFGGVAIDSGFLEGSDLLVPVSGSGTYNGQAFSGTWNIDIPIYAEANAVTATSLTFTEFQWPNGESGPGSYGAMQGQLDVVPGTDLEDAVSDGTYYYSWQMNDVVATAVPEPNSLALLSLGLSALAFLRRR